MTIEKIKENIKMNIGRTITIRYNGGRNKIEEYDGIIKDIYNFVFLVETINSNRKETKSFSYTDILTEALVIKID